MKEVKENDVAKSLRWLSNMFPFVEHPEDEADRMSNAIHIYSKAGAEKNSGTGTETGKTMDGSGRWNYGMLRI